MCLTEGDVPRGMKVIDELWRQWMEDNYFQIIWNLDAIKFDLLFTRRGDKISLKER